MSIIRFDWKWTVCFKASQVFVRRKILIRYADLIVDTSKGLTSMIDSFLVYSKLENGKATVKERPFRLKDIAEQLKMEYESFAAKKQLELSVSNKADGVVNGDKEKVLTIGRNLLSNAKIYGKG